MIRPRNPLATLLRLRGIQERRERGALARAERALADSRAQVAARKQVLDALSMAGGPLSAAQLRAVRMQGDHAYELLRAAREAAASAEAERDAAAAAASRAAIRRKSTERLVERRDLEAQALARTAAARALDELVVTRRSSS